MTRGSKHDRAVEAAADQFMRYGFARTTMGDIARAADMSRPALYLLFPSKDDAFEAAVLHLNELRFAEIDEALRSVRGLAARLFTVCDLWLVQVHELQITTPDAGDMDDLSFPVVRKVYADLQALLARLIEEADLPSLPAEPLRIARNLVFGVRGLGATATSAEDMRGMTRLAVDMLCAAVERLHAA
ncbi:MAG: TetR/AcrR family transcriptional regulator [Novosphingobium sp.]|nr:TetR/AcrR family transcriptional regulator [Novosphingobium sp.]